MLRIFPILVSTPIVLIALTYLLDWATRPLDKRSHGRRV